MVTGSFSSVVTSREKERYLPENSQCAEKTVEEAFMILAPEGGFILAAIDQLFKDTNSETS